MEDTDGLGDNARSDEQIERVSNIKLKHLIKKVIIKFVE